MEKILLRSATFICIIVLSNYLKKRKLFNKEDSRIISKIVVNITMPCALIVSATNFTFDLTSLVIVLIAFSANFIMAFIGKKVFSKYSRLENGSAMFSCTGYNIGNITIPFATAFFNGTAMSYICMFDVGNFTCWMGGVYPYIKNFITGGKEKFGIKSLLKILFTSVPFVTYFTLIVLAIFRIKLSDYILSAVGTVASANSFLVFFMIGLMVEIRWDKLLLLKSAKILVTRFIGFLILATLVYFVAPLPQLAKVAIILCLSSPIPNVAVVFSRELGDESSLPALVNSLSIIFGLITSSIVLMVFL